MKFIKGMKCEDINNLLETNKWEIRLKDKVYLGNNEAHDWICKCGEVIKNRSFASIIRRNSTLCSKCIYEKKEKEYKNLVECVEGYKYIRSYRAGDVTTSGKIVKDSPYIKVEHLKCKRKYDILVSSFKAGNRCEICSNFKNNKLLKGMTKKEVDSILQRKGVEIRLKDEIYTGNNEAHDWFCGCGKIIKNRSFAKIESRKSNRCNECLYNIKENEYKKIVECVDGYSYIRSYRAGEVTNSGIVVKDSPYIEIQHECGRIYSTTAASFKQGKKRCRCATYDKSVHKKFPEISRLIYSDKNQKELSDEEKKYIHSTSSKGFYFKCEQCGMIGNKIKRLATVVRDGYSCEFCSDGIDIPEKFHIHLLQSLGIKFTHNRSFKWSKRKLYDFYLPEYDIIIETHGIQHYEESPRGRSLAEEQKNDAEKEDRARGKVSDYIVIDCRCSTLEWIKNNCIKSLEKFIELSQVNWNWIWEECQKSYVIEAWDLNKKGYTNKEIASELGFTETTIRKYLKLGSGIDRCTYEKIERARKVICITTEEIFESLSKAGASIGLTQKEMFRCCNSKNKQLGKSSEGIPLKWLYYDDYLEMNEEELNLLKGKVHYANREVICITTEKIFKNSGEAAKYYNTQDRNIRACCYERRNYSGTLPDGTPLFWMFLENYKKASLEEINRIKHKKRNYAYVKVECITTGEVFESLKAAAIKYSVSSSNINSCCNGKRNFCGKLLDGRELKWRFVDGVKK